MRGGIVEAWPVGLGLIPLGLAFGVLVTQTGFEWWWTPLFSIIVYAGSMEFLAIGLVMAHTGLLGSAVTAFMVNFRHIFYGLTFPRDVIGAKPGGSRILRGLGRTYSTYALTDESYAIASARPAGAPPLTGARLLSIQVFCQFMWVISGIVGALSGRALPEGLVGFEFALTALFTVLAIDAFRVNRDWSLPASAVACVGVGWLVNPGQMLVIGLVLYFAVLLARVWSPRLDAALTWRSGTVPLDDAHLPAANPRTEAP
ncbi:branched-chain amino acid ABC transporter permease [Corynebacterium xerosis]|uniref:Branched-chain amino acid ABC transporter permease n=1 Tax=Corynebacterium xerosis TaxID=1725 RepID=A0A2N6SXJ2_9CORY|nr:AzlC family ABC transporter permease [Corynebacterium xerosis]PMC61803.1 branched-chain amino acid ABC transporter permease [Corynebacterium xerosis]